MAISCNPIRRRGKGSVSQYGKTLYNKGYVSKRGIKSPGIEGHWNIVKFDPAHLKGIPVPRDNSDRISKAFARDARQNRLWLA